MDIKAGSGNGLPPSPGHTTLTQIPGGKFAVDSFFDITYQITFQGCPGSMLDGMSGSTQSTLRMRTGVPAGVPVPSVAPWGVGALGALLFAGALYGVRRAKS